MSFQLHNADFCPRSAHSWPRREQAFKSGQLNRVIVVGPFRGFGRHAAPAARATAFPSRCPCLFRKFSGWLRIVEEAQLMKFILPGFLSLGGVLWAQTATLRGVVTDQSGAAVPNATVTVKGPAGLARTIET